jgi:tetratricopeptide (TPR) repeat protein
MEEIRMNKTNLAFILTVYAGAQSLSDAEAYFHRGNTYYDKGEYDRAIADYTQAIWLDPNTSCSLG